MTVTSGGNVQKRVSNVLGTVDLVIQEKKIFTALAKMPDKVQKTLLKNGWIGKDSSGENPNVLSLHKNLERVKTVVKRYESGLIWTDNHSRGVNWSELHPTVMVNRFPRDANAVLKLCGPAMAGKPQFNCFYPRAYPVTEVTAASRFTSDYSLTACASLLHTFVDGCGVKCTKNGQVPLWTLHFAVKKCEQYTAAAADYDDDDDDVTDGHGTELTGDGAEWRSFFEHYHKAVDEHQRFAMPADRAELDELTAAGRRALHGLAARRPQTAMDGRRNVWTIKCNRPTGPRARVSNRADDILARCGRLRAAGGDAADCVVQKYVETPLLARNDRFVVRAWLVVSTLDARLAVWLHRTCCVHRRRHRLTVDAGGGGGGGHGGARPSHRHAVRGPVQTCALKHLRGRLRAAVNAVNDPGRGPAGDSAVSQKIRRSVVSTALAAADVLNLRPNCLELFQATFVVADDFHPWLIDVESDPWVADGVAADVANILIRRHRGPEDKIGMFDLLHSSPTVPGTPYEPRLFSDKPIPKRCVRTRVKAHDFVPRHGHDESIDTYVEKIQVDDTDDYYPARKVPVYMTTGDVELKNRNTVRENELSLSDLEKSMTGLKVGPKIDTYRAKHCLDLLDKWKMKVMSAQRLYQTVLTNNRK